MDQLYTPREAAPLLKMNYDSILREVRAGRLRAKLRTTLRPSKRPDGTPRKRVSRVLIPASAIEEYIAAMPDAGPQVNPAILNRSRAPRGLREEIAQCVNYDLM